MLLDIFVTVPTLLMTTIAWYICVGLLLICLVMPFAVAVGALTFYRVRANGYRDPMDIGPEPVPMCNPEPHEGLVLQ
jgi:hypothetical protein